MSDSLAHRFSRGLARLLALWLSVTIVTTSLSLSPVAAQSVPPDFTDELVASVTHPTALAFTPDGRLLIATKSGRLRVVKNDLLLDTPALDLSARICDDSERGLLGVAVDPDFSTNHLVYLYYTFQKHTGCRTDGQKTPVNRVSRFTLDDSDTIDPASELILINNIPSPHGNHNGGDLHFGPAGNLYVSVGDGGCDLDNPNRCQYENNNVRHMNRLLGKILRITPDGSIPGDNPFLGNGTARCNERGHTRRKTKCREIFTTGLRNPFRFAFDPNGSRFFINDVGGVKWEEIDEGASGANYGWNRREGPCKAGSTSQCGDPPSSVTDPIFAYRHTTGCDVITGAAFVPDGLWPGFNGVYLFADFACSKIFVLTPDGSGGFDANFNEPFATQLDGPVSMRFGPYNATQALYYATFRTGGQIRRIIYTP